MPNEKKPISRRKPKDDIRAPGPIDGPPAEDFDDDDPAPVSARPVAVGPAATIGSTSYGTETPAPEGSAGEPFLPFHDEDASPAATDVERPWVEVGIGVACFALALSVFAQWFSGWPKGSFQIGNVSGWSSGTWGPAIFFVALTGLAVVVLRRLRVPVAFPFDAPLVIELCGWTCAVMLILKRLLHPATVRFLAGWYIALLLSVAIAGTAGFATKASSFVLRPGWFSSAAGKLGALILAIAVVGGTTFGLAVGSVSSSAPISKGPQTITEQGVPKCAKQLKLPVPKGVTAVVGYSLPQSHGAVCTMVMKSTLSQSLARARFVSMIAARHWKVTKGSLANALSFTGSVCGQVTILAVPKKGLSIIESGSSNCSLLGQKSSSAQP